MKKVIDYTAALDIRMFDDNLFLAFGKTDDVSPPYFTFGSGPPQFHLNIDYARAMSAAIARAITDYDTKKAKAAADKIDALSAQAHRVLDTLTPVVEPKADDELPF